MRKASIVLVVAGMVLLLGASAKADNKCTDSWCSIKDFAGNAKDVTDYYESAKDYVEVGTKVFQALGFINTKDGQQRFEQIKDAISQANRDIDWGQAQAIIGDAYTDADTAINSIKQNNGQASQQDDRDSFQAVDRLINPGSVGVFYIAPGDNRLSRGVPSVDATPDDIDHTGIRVYDWRLGIPALLQMIAYRVTVIAALDPDFRNDGKYWENLDSYRQALMGHYSKMLSGLKCGTHSQSGTAIILYPLKCADIQTGLSTGAEPDLCNAGQCCEAHAMWSNFWLDSSLTFKPFQTSTLCSTSRQTANRQLVELKSELIRTMPLYEVKTMIDTLFLYTHPMRDLTELYQRISSSASPSLCVQANGAEAGSELQLSPCDGGDLQRWVYNRQSGIIGNAGAGKCVGISNPRAVGAGFPISLDECTGDAWQRWTYDPEARIILSDVGTALTSYFPSGGGLAGLGDFTAHLFTVSPGDHVTTSQLPPYKDPDTDQLGYFGLGLFKAQWEADQQ